MTYFILAFLHADVYDDTRQSPHAYDGTRRFSHGSTLPFSLTEARLKPF